MPKILAIDRGKSNSVTCSFDTQTNSTDLDNVHGPAVPGHDAEEVNARLGGHRVLRARGVCTAGTVMGIGVDSSDRRLVRSCTNEHMFPDSPAGKPRSR